ncbi:hypothetical protein F4808DRAFT_286438 [Astrocystis sublimbata]|nr:hypothetical protein F4808DRAFT_286438 [Astrocystis sublimbata]
MANMIELLDSVLRQVKATQEVSQDEGHDLLNRAQGTIEALINDLMHHQSNEPVGQPTTVGNSYFSGASQTLSVLPIQSAIGHSSQGAIRGKGTQKRQEKLFACPVYVENKEAHQACRDRKYERISDLRQHIGRSHTWDVFCPICYQVFLGKSKRADYEKHGKDSQCTAMPDPRKGSYADSNKWNKLGKVASSTQHRGNYTDEQRWYDIWDIMCPKSARPPSPYTENRSDRRRVEVEGALEQYYQAGGIQNFLLEKNFHFSGGFEVLQSAFLHFHNYIATISVADSGNACDASSDLSDDAE